MRRLLSALALSLAPSVLTAAQPPSRTPSAYQVLKAEYSRQPDAALLDSAVASADTTLQRLAARAFGRMERQEFASHVTPLISSRSASVRREAVNALAQMGVPFNAAALLESETDATVRNAIYESAGRMAPGAARGAPAPPPATTLSLLTRGLTDAAVPARVGAARGLESLLRRAGRGTKAPDETVVAMRSAFRDNGSAELRQLLLLALTAVGDRDASVTGLALRDTSAQVRRLAVAASREWADDPSPLVLVQALRVAGTCERAVAHLHDASDHVVLAAVDVLGEKRCSATLLDSLVLQGADWRVQSQALLALARLDPARAAGGIATLRRSPIWQARAHAAAAAKVVKDSASLVLLAHDANPNVAIAAMSTTDDAIRSLRSSHAGLVFAGAGFLKGNQQLATLIPQVTASLMRLTALKRATVRDARKALLQRLEEAGDAKAIAALDPLRRDPDPDIAATAARMMSASTHSAVAPVTLRYSPPPFPAASTLASLRGVTARMVLRGLGAVELELMPDEAPVTVATFVQLAERGAYNGTTWHRIVPNFVIQGGSPGADEYDGATATFMRDEVGFARHARGMLGISTRGRDTGDGQLFVNLVDNFRLDHDYTVFARVLQGMDVVDRVQEGAVIESVTIVRHKP